MTKAKQPTRIYVVEDTTAENTGAEILVRAVNATVAQRHVIGRRYKTHVATQGDLERLLSDGARVQEPGPEQTEVRGA